MRKSFLRAEKRLGSQVGFHRLLSVRCRGGQLHDHDNLAFPCFEPNRSTGPLVSWLCQKWKLQAPNSTNNLHALTSKRAMCFEVGLKLLHNHDNYPTRPSVGCVRSSRKGQSGRCNNQKADVSLASLTDDFARACAGSGGTSLAAPGQNPFAS
jgi:hypothetical protein